MVTTTYHQQQYKEQYQTQTEQSVVEHTLNKTTQQILKPVAQSLNVLDLAVDDIDSAIGTRTYTQDNYVTDSEALTFSIDALDTALFNISADTLPAGTLDGQTLRYTGTGWVTDTNLFNDGTNIGIGTTNPQYKLEVVGDIKIPSASDLYIGGTYLNEATNATDSGAYLVGLFDDSYYNVSSATVQGAVSDLDGAIGGRTYSEETMLLILKPQLNH